MPDTDQNDANVARFSGFADTYDAYRPTPPPVFADVLTQLAGTERPALVVDLGCGTGLSTRLWAARSEQVIGIEPNDDMRAEAVRQTAAANVRYQPGYGHASGLPDGCADIVTVSQALHWMEPETTFPEIGRILRSGGVFAAIDNDWPPTMHWEAEAAYDACMQRAYALNRTRGLARDVRAWSKDGHLERLQASDVFRFVREITLHSVEQGNAERLVGLALSQGALMTALKNGASEDDTGLTELRAAAQRLLGDERRPWYFSYRVRLGIK